MSFAAATGHRTYVRLRVAQHALAIPMSAVEEVADYKTPVPLPSAPAHILGLMPIRERSVPLVALDIFLDNAIACEPQRVVIVACDGMRVGIICDEIAGLRDIGQHALTEVHHSHGIHPYLSHEHQSEDGPIKILDVSAFLAAARVRKR